MTTITLICPSNGAAADGSSQDVLAMTCVDSSGKAVSGQVITLTATTGVTLSATSVTTDSTGVASAYATSTTKGTFTVTAASSGATSVPCAVIFTDGYETAAANRVLSTMQTALAGTGGANYVGWNSSVSYSAGTLGAAFNSGTTQLSSLTSKQARWIDIEDYADTNSAAGDWTTAIQAAIDATNTLGIYNVRGTGSYAVSSTVKIRNVPSSGLNIAIYKITTLSAFPSNTTFWDATPVISIGDTTGNIVGLNLFINYLDGGSKADGITGVSYGYGTSHVHIGYATNCIAVMRMGQHDYTSATNWITGDNWVGNWMGVYLANGTSGTSPIVEAWIIDVKFIANNRWGGMWYFDAGQYGQIRGDWDYNGTYLAVLGLSTTTGLSSIAGQTGLKLTDGTTQMEFLFYYTYQGTTYIVVAASSNISKASGTGAVPWTAGSTISCTTVTGVSLVFSTSEIAGDNASGSNYFDILHDFERAPFGRIQVVAGYISGIIGGNLYTSSFQYQNSFSGTTDSFRGFGISNSGTALSFYNYALASTPIANFTSSYVNFPSKLSTAYRLIEGGAFASQIAASSSTTSALLTLVDQSTDKYYAEGTMYDITLKTNYAGTCGSYRVFVISSGGSYSHVVVSTYSGDAIAVTFTDTTSGVQMNFRQEAQTSMAVAVNAIRI
ncbi:MAG: Ig-like domain-containing protein [Rouxiella badensis]|jgi:hypothetical protein|uniref:Big-1 domain-containing protein n=1 Tax=Rouxiella badensis TaxID=1646377 RepID=A0A1X0WG77_9GAMM|nr:Ig-like domain-containing protein [Rouxiella badensis]ORJ25754.1 hypothetical protein BS640_08855 [Rouxiella badensis]QII37234.1 hypothetical protein G3M83_05770 [Rouxiella badensis]WAT04602.1 Ig-like domain-containing protein [Rouxiella badensis]